jgi:hypothetical protein
MTTKRKRKPNWNAGLTRAQKAIADQISGDQIIAFERERAAGSFGAPGSVWYIAPDGTAQFHGLTPKEFAIAAGSNVVLLSEARRQRRQLSQYAGKNSRNLTNAGNAGNSTIGCTWECDGGLEFGSSENKNYYDCTKYCKENAGRRFQLYFAKPRHFKMAIASGFNGNLCKEPIAEVDRSETNKHR